METNLSIEELLREAFNAATDLRCELDGHPQFVKQADEVLSLVQMAAFTFAGDKN